MEIDKVKAQIGLPFGLGQLEGEWVPGDNERSAAWEMYIELITRVSVVELGRDEGMLRDALDSLYSLFGTTREILRRYGPSVARPSGGGSVSFGHLAVAVLNRALRPLLAKWHPLLRDHEQSRPTGVSTPEWEWNWDRAGALRDDLDQVRETLDSYAGLLAEVCDARSLLTLARPPLSHG